MEPVARYYDGITARVHSVTFALTRDAAPVLVIADEASREELDRWPAGAVFEALGRAGELRLGAADRPAGARLVLDDKRFGAALRQALPAVGKRIRLEGGQQRRILGGAVAALASIIVAYVFGVPLLARAIVPLVPAAWEERLGASAGGQVEGLLGGLPRCAPSDPRVQQAVDRFATQVMEESGSPFIPKVSLVRSTIPNAFALPGGRVYYFSALLDMTETQEEFAGVLAHELGHVAHRHAMEGLISSSATGLLVGFVLGDMTNLSVAAAIGATLIDSRFSREAEREADRFAAEAGARLGFSAAGLADLLERVAVDDAMSRSLAFLSTHPLTEERREALKQLEAEGVASGARPFSDAEWSAIKLGCAS